jgi:hypothetical protein
MDCATLCPFRERFVIALLAMTFQNLPARLAELLAILLEAGKESKRPGVGLDVNAIFPGIRAAG